MISVFTDGFRDGYLGGLVLGLGMMMVIVMKGRRVLRIMAPITSSFTLGP